MPAPGQSTQLGVQVGTRPAMAALTADHVGEPGQRPAMAALTADHVGEPGQRPVQALLVGVPAATQALLQPVDSTAVPALGVAAAARGDLVLQPGRATLHPGHHVLGRGCDQAGEGAAAPDAGGSVAVEDLVEPGGTAGQRAGHRLHGAPGTTNAPSREREGACAVGDTGFEPVTSSV